MKLVTSEIEKALLSAPKDVPAHAKPIVVKVFTPDAGCTWLITDAEKEDGDLRMFGLCDLGLGFPELGYVMLSELTNVRGKLGLGVERDLYLSPMTLAEAMRAHGL